MRSVPIATFDRLRVAALFALAVGVFGIVGRDVVVWSGIGQPIVVSNNVFFRLYALHEAPFLWLTAVVGLLTWAGAYRKPDQVSPRWSRAVMAHVARLPGWLVAVTVLALTAAGSVLVMHGVGLSMDEFAAGFQARIFASGRLEAPVPVEWRGVAPWMTPVFVNYKPVAGLWVSAYLPVYAAMRAFFVLAAAEWLLNPILAAASVMLLVAVARRMWLGGMRIRRSGLALLFLVLSAQFIVTSMSGYSMPAHLFLNLLWLWLYISGHPYGLAALPWVGVLALGLHNPVPHALFVAPFLLRLVRDRRFAWAAYCAAVYLVGALAWYQWLVHVHTDLPAAAAAVAHPGVASGYIRNFALPGLFSWFVQGLSLALFFTWQTPALAIFLPVGLMAWRRLGPVERDMAVGLVATWGFYAFFSADQGHGWGYRYLYPVLGNAVLLAARGADETWRIGRSAFVGRLLAASALITVAVQLPLRALQTERFVRPYAAALDHIATRRAAVVVLDAESAWYGRDLVRNDPLFAKGPKVIAVRPIPGGRLNLTYLPELVRDSIHVLTTEELAGVGLPVFQRARR